MQTGNRTMPHGEEAASSNAASSVDHDRTIVRTVPTEERPQPPVMVKVLSGSLPIRPATTSGRATAASSDAERGPGVRMVGRYEIIEKIGEGAMAAVYRAYDPSIDRPLAIKFLHANLSADPEYRSRFLREARAAGMLSHPNIVTVFDVGEIEGRPYIAMELLDGGPLDEKTKSNERFAVADVMKIGSQLASALDFAHSRGIFHRDIKPSNIVLVAGREQIKVTDFGIAHMAASSHSQATRVGTMIGTPHYMSPEQAMGQKVDARSDLFSVGVVMYELLTGQRPFNADSVVTLVYRIAKEEPRPIESFRNDVPSALRRIVDRCLNKEPNRRYQSGAELVSDLDKLSRQLAEQAAQRGAPRLAPLRRQWSLVVGAVVAVTMAIASSVINRHQQQVMLDQLIGHGAALSRLIATENAAAALSDDWVAVDVSVQDVAKTLRLERLLATDAAGVVRVATDASLVGRPIDRARGAPLRSQDPGVAVQRVNGAAGSALDFEVPIQFQDKSVGKVQLVLSEASLTEVARGNWLMMVLLLVVTVAAAVIAMYLIAMRFARPIRLLQDALDEFGPNRLDVRIGETRRDEFGGLFRAFDRMAARVEQQIQPRTLASAPRVDVAPAASHGEISPSPLRGPSPDIAKAPG